MGHDCFWRRAPWIQAFRVVFVESLTAFAVVKLQLIFALGTVLFSPLAHVVIFKENRVRTFLTTQRAIKSLAFGVGALPFWSNDLVAEEVVTGKALRTRRVLKGNRAVVAFVRLTKVKFSAVRRLATAWARHVLSHEFTSRAFDLIPQFKRVRMVAESRTAFARSVHDRFLANFACVLSLAFNDQGVLVQRNLASTRTYNVTKTGFAALAIDVLAWNVPILGFVKKCLASFDWTDEKVELT